MAHHQAQRTTTTSSGQTSELEGSTVQSSNGDVFSHNQSVSTIIYNYSTTSNYLQHTETQNVTAGVPASQSLGPAKAAPAQTTSKPPGKRTPVSPKTNPSTSNTKPPQNATPKTTEAATGEMTNARGTKKHAPAQTTSKPPGKRTPVSPKTNPSTPTTKPPQDATPKTTEAATGGMTNARGTKKHNAKRPWPSLEGLAPIPQLNGSGFRALPPVGAGSGASRPHSSSWTRRKIFIGILVVSAVGFYGYRAYLVPWFRLVEEWWETRSWWPWVDSTFLELSWARAWHWVF